MAGTPASSREAGGAETGEWDAIVRKAADESLSASTVLQADDELLFPVLANQAYMYKLVVAFVSPTAADFKHNVAVTAGALVANTAWRRTSGLGPTSASTQLALAALTDIVQAGIGTDAAQFEVLGAIVPSANANLVFQWAQNTSDAGTTTVKLGSYLAYRAID